MSISRTATEPNGSHYETHRNWDVAWDCWRQVVFRIDANGDSTVLSDERIIDNEAVVSHGRPGHHAMQEMLQIEAEVRRDDRRADRQAKVEYYEALEDGGMF